MGAVIRNEEETIEAETICMTNGFNDSIKIEAFTMIRTTRLAKNCWFNMILLEI